MRTLLLSLVLVLGLPRVASAEVGPADPDPTFGAGGVTMATKVSNRSETAHEVVRTPDGGYYASGTAAPARPSFVLRYRSDGTRDAEWGNTGELRFPGDVGGRAWQLAVDGQGRLVAGADVALCPDGPESCSGRAALMRITPEGAFDESFSGDGRLLLAEGDSLEDLAVDGDGRILVGVKTAGRAARVIRLLPSGTADDSFAATDLPHPAEKIVPHGAGVAVAARPEESPHGGYVLTRLGATGAIDTGFGDQGVARHVVAGDGGTFGDLLALPDGRLIVGWGRLTVHAYLPDGRPDVAFGQDGVAAVDTGGAANGLAVDTAGRIVATVNQVVPAAGAKSHILLARFLPTGAPDTGFGAAGRAFASFDPAYDGYAADVLVDTAGRIVVLGVSAGDDHVHEVIAMARFRGGDAPVPVTETKTEAPPAVTAPAITPPSPVAPTLELSTPRRSKVRSRRFTVNARYGAPAIVSARAVLRSGKRRWTVRSTGAAVDAGVPAVLRLRLPAPAARALRAGRKVSARVTVEVLAEGATVAAKAYATRLHQ